MPSDASVMPEEVPRPQLARPARSLPPGDEWAYEPKLDGFRAIVVTGESGTELHSRSGKPLTRYFPELVFPVGEAILDGEIVVRDDRGREDFAALSQRIHPAASRIRRLAEETPAQFVAFDLLRQRDESLLELPFAERRARLEALAGEALELTELTGDPAVAERWLAEREGVVAKDLTAPYRTGERIGMVKIKRIRTMDCVVMGWRPGIAEGTIGSLILGAYDGPHLRPVGHTSGLNAKQKRDLREKLAPYETGARGEGAASRWSAGRELEWVELRPDLVVEVAFDHTSGGRIRHGAKILRWRDDRDPRDCLVDQLSG